MVKKTDLIKIEILLKLQLGLIEEIDKFEKITEDDILAVLEMIKNMSKEIEEDVTVLLKQKSENKKSWEKKLKSFN